MEETNGEIKNFSVVIPSLPISQLELLAKFLELPERCGFVHTQAEGSSVAALAQRGLVEKAAKVGERQRWQVTDSLSREHRDLIKRLLNLPIY